MPYKDPEAKRAYAKAYREANKERISAKAQVAYSIAKQEKPVIEFLDGGAP